LSTPGLVGNRTRDDPPLGYRSACPVGRCVVWADEAEVERLRHCHHQPTALKSYARWREVVANISAPQERGSAGRKSDAHPEEAGYL
ncbi:MAG TPA: hypothetical protein VKK81_17505, partial [Candidatus Binatia bacterium]|nr:hypothetical protein [Candidatus Binatia bacterium]